MKNVFIFFGNFYFLNAAKDCKTCNYTAQTNEVMEFQVQVSFRHGSLDGSVSENKSSPHISDNADRISSRVTK